MRAKTENGSIVDILAFAPVGPEVRAVVADKTGRLDHVGLRGLTVLPDAPEITVVPKRSHHAAKPSPK